MKRSCTDKRLPGSGYCPVTGLRTIVFKVTPRPFKSPFIVSSPSHRHEHLRGELREPLQHTFRSVRCERDDG